jgi:single-stranded DNA-binding protein
MSKSDIPDANDITFSGVVTRAPSWFQLSANKKALIFTIRSEEVFKKSDGSTSSHPNEMDIEVLGKSADQYFLDIKLHTYCSVKGYVRTDIIDGVKKARIRSYRITYKGSF